jgi:hypothetical protein
MIISLDQVNPHRDRGTGFPQGQALAAPLLRRTNSALPRIEQAVVQREAHLDGTWLIRTPRPNPNPGDLAAAH